MNKAIFTNKDAIKKLIEGIEKSSDIVLSTLGPCGKIIKYEKHGEIVKTKDGVTVAKECLSTNPVEISESGKLVNRQYHRLGIASVADVAKATVKEAGDGTTTSVALFKSIVKEGSQYISAGSNSVYLTQGVFWAVDKVTNFLQGISVPVKDSPEMIKNVATVSANGDIALGSIVKKAFDAVGTNGVITVESGKSVTTELEIISGTKLKRGYKSPLFITDKDRQICELENALVLIYEGKISSIKQLQKILEEVLKDSRGRPLLIIAQDFDNIPLALLTLNVARGVLKAAAIQAPEFGENQKELLQDLAVQTGAKLFSEELDDKLEKATISDLGQAQKVKITSDSTLVIGGNGSQEEIDKRYSMLLSQASDCEKSEYEVEKLKLRAASFKDGVAIIHVGGTREAEISEEKDRAVDSVHASQSAIQEGILPGGGVPFVYASQMLSSKLTELISKLSNYSPISHSEKETDENKLLRELQNTDRSDAFISGIKVVIKALEYPILTNLHNAGLSDDAQLIIQEIKNQSSKEKNFGYDIRTREFKNLLKAGVIDSFKSLRVGLEHAANVACKDILTCGGFIQDMSSSSNTDDKDPYGM